MTVVPGIRPALPFAAAALLAACVQAPPAPEPAPAPRFMAPSATEAARNDAIRRHREYAAASRGSGDLATAHDHLQVAALLDPDNASLRRDLQTVEAQIGAQVRDHLEAARAATRAGDATRAATEYLRVLALDPRNADAARALRDFDRQTMARAQSGRIARIRMEDLVADTRAARPPALANAPGIAPGSDPTSRVARAAAAPAAVAAAAEPRDAVDLDIRLELLRAGDTSSALRELKAWVDAHPKDRAARQRIGAAVAERAKDAESRGQRGQALSLYEQALALRGEPMAEWTARVVALRKGASEEYYNEGVKLMRTDLPGAIGKFEAALKADPQNTNAAMRLRETKAMHEKLSKLPAK